MTRDIKELKAKQKELIKSQCPIPCPAFNGEEIHIGRTLFEHLTSKPRKENELRKRLESIPLAFRIIEKSYLYQKHSIEPSQNKEYWSFTGVLDRCCIEAVVRETKGSYKQLYSVVYKGVMPIRLGEKKE